VAHTPTSSSRQSSTEPVPPRRLLPGIPARQVNARGLVQGSGQEPAQEEAAAPAGKLILGASVRFRGTIEQTRRVVVHGRADATLPAGDLEVAAGGVFRGRADVESATIAGHFDGTLMVSGRLTVAATGTVTGTVRYGELAVEAGGEMTGDIGRERPAPPTDTAPAERAAEVPSASPDRSVEAPTPARAARTPELA